MKVHYLLPIMPVTCIRVTPKPEKGKASIRQNEVGFQEILAEATRLAETRGNEE